MDGYSRRLSQASQACEQDHLGYGYSQKAYPWRQGREAAEGRGAAEEIRPPTEGQRELQAELAQHLRTDAAPRAADSDLGDVGLRCHHCRLPLGRFAYHDEDDNKLHAECKALDILMEHRRREHAWAEEVRAKKDACRVQHGIGWKIESVPENQGPLRKLGFEGIPAGAACCLVLDAATNTVSLAPTAEPSAAVNLEYLSIALKVRAECGREPYFSLDASQPGNPETMQSKVFAPSWLAGTSVGEVMFQADYHLKELSMGEYSQPVTGMKSSFEFEEADRVEPEAPAEEFLEDLETDKDEISTKLFWAKECKLGSDVKLQRLRDNQRDWNAREQRLRENQRDWNAREWFVVRTAEMWMSEDGVLVPYVKMGVEAREQVLKDGKMVDKAVTRPSHPLVKYAEQFTRNFDLIAERKSVIYHLRELAKASVLAKFLLEAQVNLDSAWFELAGESKEAGVLEVPQLWNKTGRVFVEVADGVLGGTFGRHRIISGGVDFGLERFSVARPFAPRSGGMGAIARLLGPRAAARVGPMRKVPSLHLEGGARAVSQRLSSIGGAGVGGSVRSVAGPSRMFRGRSSMAPRLAGFAPRITGFGSNWLASQHGDPRGVDLNLDNFSLSQAQKAAPRKVAGSWGAEAVDDIAEVASRFWSSIDGEEEEEAASVLAGDDRRLLGDVFNPHLSDRRGDRERFIPPDTDASTVSRLRGLLREEEVVRQRRRKHFLSGDFAMGDAGALFPLSWTSLYSVGVRIVGGKTEHKALAGPPASGVLQPRHELASAPTVLDLVKEVAPIFRMSTEDGTRFRIYRAGSLELRTTQAHAGRELVGAAFVIRQRGSPDTLKRKTAGKLVVKVVEYVEREANADQVGCHSFLVLETADGTWVTTEILLARGSSWREGPDDLDARRSAAKVVRSQKLERPVELSKVLAHSQQVESRRYAQLLFEYVTRR